MMTLFKYRQMKLPISLVLTMLLFFPIMSIGDNTTPQPLSSNPDYNKDSIRQKIAYFISLKQNEKAIHEYEKLLTPNFNLPYQERIKIQRNVAYLYSQLGKSSKAMQYLQAAVNTSLEKNDSMNYANSIQNIGNIFLDWKKMDKAFECYMEAHKIYHYYNDPVHLAATHNNLGLFYKNDSSYNMALAHLDSSLQINKDLKNSKEIILSLNNIGTIYCLKEDYTTGLQYFKEALKLKAPDTEPEVLVKLFGNISRIYSFNNDIASSLALMDSANHIINQLELRPLKAVFYRNLSDMYYTAKNYSKAYDYLWMYKQIDDSIFSAKQYQIIQELNTSFEVQKKEDEILVLRNKEALNKLRMQKQNTIVFFLVIIIFLMISLYLLLRRKNRIINLNNINLAEKNLNFQADEKRLLKRIRILEEENKAKEAKMESTVANEMTKSKPVISIDTKEVLLEKLLILFQNEELYVDKNLNIDCICRRLNSNQKYISHIINEEFGQNFNQFINSYRVKKAMELLSEPTCKYTIEAISEMAGFNSKSTFNAAFKKQTGITPSYFRDYVLNGESENKKKPND